MSKQYARIQDGQVAETIELPDDVAIGDAFAPDLVWVEITSLQVKPVEGWRFADDAFTAPPGPDLAAARASRKAYIESQRDAACARDVTVTVAGVAHPWQADATSRDLVGNAVALGALNVITPPAVWRSADNAVVPITLNDLKAIAVAISNQVADAYAKSWVLKQQIDAAQTLQAIEAVTW